MLLRLWCAFLLTFLALNAQTKLDPSLSGATGQVPVMVLLADQPHGAIAAQTYTSYAPQLRGLEQALRNLPDDSPARDSLLSQLDRLHSQIRNSIKSQIGVRVGSTQLAAQARMGLLGATKVRRFNLANLMSARIPASALASLQNDSDVAYIFRDRRMSMNLDISTQALGAQAFWNAPLNILGVGVKVGVIDTGVANHLALAGAITDQNVFLAAAQAAPASESLYADDGTVNDNQGHGTHVAGIVASRGTPAGANIRGVARGASIVNLKAGYLTSTGGGSMYFSDFFDAIDWGYFTANVSIFNYSFGGATAGEDPVENQILDDMVKTYGLFFAVAAGNSGTVNLPGYAYNTTQVGAMDDKNTVGTGDDTVASFSSIGPTPAGRSKPDLAAPGVNIVSLDKNGTGFVSLSGTSMATPHIAGAAALLWQAGITDPLQIKALLIHSPSATSGWTNNKGWGYTNLVNTAAQLPLVSSGTIPAATTRLYKVTNASGTIKATMVWDRYFTNVGGVETPNFNNLDMALYSRTGNTLQGVASPSPLNNVEQVATGYTGNFVLRISSPATLAGGLASQGYAFVLSPAAAASTLAPASGPDVSISCTPPVGAQMNVAMQVSCTATNSGDLEAFSVQAAVTQPSGWSTASNLNFGIISPATSKTLAWTLTPKTFGAGITLPIALTGAAFGSTLGQNTSVTFNVLPPVYNITGRVTLNSSSGPGVQGVTMTLSGGASASALTDASGNYAFNGLASGLAYTVTPAKTATKFSPTTYSTSALNANTSASFNATSIISISGRITDSATGLGVANVTVKTLGTTSVSGVTNSNGDYSLLNVTQGGNYSVIPTPPANTKLNVAKVVYLQSQTLADLTGVNFVLSSITTVANNESSTAGVIATLPAYIVLIPASATVNSADPLPSCAFERGNDSVWYQFTANFTGTLDLSTFGSTYDTLIAAYSGTTPSLATEVGCNDDYAGSLYSKLYLPVVSGQSYRFVVSGANASTTSSTLVLTVSRAN